MKINAIDIKPGNVLEHQNKLWVVLKRELVQPGKGGAFAQVELRDLRGGSKLNERFRTQETVERVRLDEKEMQFLFMDGGLATFMDNDTFEQIPISRETIGDPADFLSEGMVCQVMVHEGSALSVELPPNVVVEVVEADPAAYRPGHAYRRQHRRRKLPRAGQRLASRLTALRRLKGPGPAAARDRPRRTVAPQPSS
jgi:elongation factor P